MNANEIYINPFTLDIKSNESANQIVKETRLQNARVNLKSVLFVAIITLIVKAI
jgi:hypothetical protein